MKNILASIFVGLLSGVTVYLLIDNLFERPNKSVKPSPGVDQDIDQDGFDVVYEEDDQEKEDGWKIKPNLKDIAKAN